MHQLMTQHLVDSRIEQLHREAERARLIKAAKRPAIEVRHAAPPRPHFLPRLAATLVVSVFMVVALGTAALASYPVSGSDGSAGPVRADVPVCLPKQSPKNGICRHAGTGELASTATDGVRQSGSTGPDGNDLTPVWVTGGLFALLATAGLAIQSRGRVATA